MAVAESDIDKSMGKVRHYGANDLEHIGRVLARSQQRRVSAEEATELGILFYLSGKMARIEEAMVRGERPDDDSIFDLQYYAQMIRRVRAAGSWPGPIEREENDE